MNHKPLVVVTGASGFVGDAMVRRLVADGRWKVRVASRGLNNVWPAKVEKALMDDLAPDADYRSLLDGCAAVIHLAARVHIMRDNATDPLSAFRRVNTAGTLNLARQAAELRVSRLIYISTIKVNGENTPINKPYTADDVPAPTDPYGVSKHEAELGLIEIAQATGLEVVIIRPVLVYGPGVRANFVALMRWLYRRVPLPLGAVNNLRSLVALDNLVDLIATSIDHPAAANQTFLVSDGEDLSTTELLQRMGAALRKPARLLPVPTGLLKVVAALVGKGDVAQRLLGSLRVDISKTRETLNWTPPVSVEESLRKTAESFLAKQ